MTPQELFESALEYHKGSDTTPKNYKKAYELFHEAAVAGHSGAQAYLGRMLCMGEGVERNYEEAVKWLLPAAEAGEADAQNRLTPRYILGEGVEKNKEKAFIWAVKAADQGHAKAMSNLAAFYKMGWVIEQDSTMAYRWYEKAAEAGNHKAMALAGDLLNEGKGIERNPMKARQWYKKALKYKPAKHKLANMYVGNASFEYNPKESIRHLYASKDIWSRLVIADFSLYGQGIPSDPYEAVRIWQSIYQQGFKLINYNLALACLYGIGTDKDISKAMNYLAEVKDMDNDALAVYMSISEGRDEKFDFRRTPMNIKPDSIISAEIEILKYNAISAIKILEKNPSKESYFWLARLYQDDELDNNLEKSEEYFYKAIELGHPYALYIQSINDSRGRKFAKYDLYEPFYLNDLITTCYPDQKNSLLADKLSVIYSIMKANGDLDDRSFITQEWERKLYGYIGKSLKAVRQRKELFDRCMHKELISFIKESMDYIWEELERGKENSLESPSKSFIDSLNKALADSETICYYDKFSLKYLKFIDESKKHIFLVQKDKDYVTGNLIVDILGLKNVTIKLEENDEVIQCDTLVKIPDLSHKNDQEVEIRLSDLYQRENIISALNERNRVKKAIILVNKEFCSSYATELYFTRRKLFARKALETVIEFDKETFTDIPTSTSLLVLNFEKENDSIRFINKDKETIASYKDWKDCQYTLNSELYMPTEEVGEGKRIVKFNEMIRIRTSYDKVTDPDNGKVQSLSDKDYQNTLLNAVSTQNRYTGIEDYNPDRSIIRQFRGPHIFLKSKNGVKINIHTDMRLCAPGYDAHAFRLLKDSPISLEYLAYLLMSNEVREYIAGIVDKNGDFMARDLLHKKIAIHTDRAVQNRIVEDALIKERQASGSGVEYNVVVVSPDVQKIDHHMDGRGINIFRKITDIYDKEHSFEALYEKYIEDPSKAMVDAVIIDDSTDDHADIFTYFNTIRDRNIHLYLLTSSAQANLPGKRLKDYFIQGGRTFNCEEADWTDKMFRKLRDDLDASSSYQAKIRMKHKDVFEAADALDKKHGLGISKVIMRYIQNGYIIDYAENTAFDQLRNICHQMLKMLGTEYGLVPTDMREGAIPSLLADLKYYDKSSKKGYVMIHRIMDKHIAKSLEYFCYIANNTIHGHQDSSKLGTAALNILMDFIIWFHNEDIVRNTFATIKGNESMIYLSKDDKTITASFKNREDYIVMKSENKEKYYYVKTHIAGIGIHIDCKSDKIKVGSRIRIKANVGWENDPEEIDGTRTIFFVNEENYEIIET